jgi:hypothetical protein
MRRRSSSEKFRSKVVWTVLSSPDGTAGSTTTIARFPSGLIAKSVALRISGADDHARGSSATNAAFRTE